MIAEIGRQGSDGRPTGSGESRWGARESRPSANEAPTAAGEAVVAAAWGSGPIARRLGTPVPTLADPLHMNITEACGEGIAHLVQHAEHPLTLKQLKTGQIVIGGGWPAEDRGPDRVPGVRAHSLLGNVSLAARLVPAIRRLRLLRSWAGMNTTVDGASVIGRLPGAPRVTMAVPGGRRLHARAPRRAHGLRPRAGAPATGGPGTIQPGAFRAVRRLNPEKSPICVRRV